MRPLPLAAAAALVAAGPLGAGAAQAHARLKASSPAAGAAVAAPDRIALTFSEGLVARFSTFELAGPKGRVAVKVAARGAELEGRPAAPLAPGAYRVTWRVVSADTHRMQGRFGFTVK